MLAGDAPSAVPQASEALALARRVGAQAFIATSLLAVGLAVAGTDPGQARARLRESRELSAALGYRNALDLGWATGIAFLVGDAAVTLELGRTAIRGIQWGGDRLRMGFVLYFIAGALATSQPDAAAIIQGAVETYVVQSPIVARLISSTVTKALGEERVRELRGRGADMDWGPSRRLHPHPNHPGPQRTPLRGPAMSQPPRQPDPRGCRSLADPAAPRTGCSAMPTLDEPGWPEPRALGARFAHALERRSRYVMIAGRGRRARSALPASAGDLKSVLGPSAEGDSAKGL